MSKMTILWVALLTAALTTATRLSAQAPSPAQLVGAPVFAADGVKVGQVAEVSTNADGTIHEVRIFTGSSMGFGQRMVSIPHPAFMIGSGSVRLPGFTSDDVEAFPTVATEARGPGSQER